MVKDQIVEKKIKQNGMTKKLHQDLTVAQFEMLTGMSVDENAENVESMEPDLCHIGHQLWNFDEIYEEAFTHSGASDIKTNQINATQSDCSL